MDRNGLHNRLESCLDPHQGGKIVNGKGQHNKSQLGGGAFSLHNPIYGQCVSKSLDYCGEDLPLQTVMKRKSYVMERGESNFSGFYKFRYKKKTNKR